jgi:hypothetical protein
MPESLRPISLFGPLLLAVIATCLAYAGDGQLAAVNNATYRLITGEIAILRNGENKHVAGYIDVAVDKVAFGDLTHGGDDDAAVVLSTFYGNSTGAELHALVNRHGRFVDVAAADLGRPRVYSLAIRRGRIVIDLLTQGPNEPLCCPTLHAVRDYRVIGTQLKIVRQIKKE